MTRSAPDTPDAAALAARVNVLYHSLQADRFDAIHRHRHRVESMFWQQDALPLLAGSRQGVDLCCGTGFVSSLLLGELPDCHVLCQDVSDGAVAFAAGRLAMHGARVSTHAGDAASIPLADGSADWVAINAAVHHIPDPPPVLGEIDRVLAPGGLFCLGHEPNRVFFSSAVLRGLERLIWHGFWYFSPGRNLRRLQRRLGSDQPAEAPDENLDEINRRLLDEGAITQPLSQQQLRGLVDVHTRDIGDDEAHTTGFDARRMIAENFPGYEIVCLRFTDYGGDMLRPHRRLRGAFDAMMRWLRPERGRLFCWILRKPDTRANSGS